LLDISVVESVAYTVSEVSVLLFRDTDLWVFVTHVPAWNTRAAVPCVPHVQRKTHLTPSTLQ